jgi:hypothetical protein
MTTTATKVQTKWETKKIQDSTARVIASIWISAYQTLSKYGQEAHQEFANKVNSFKVEHYKSLGIKTPIELVKAMAEMEYNLFGSEIEISGDEKRAEIKHNTCGMWNAMQQLGKFTPEQEEKLGKNFQESLSQLAKEFGFKSEAKMEKDTCVVTFTK